MDRQDHKINLCPADLRHDFGNALLHRCETNTLQLECGDPLKKIRRHDPDHGDPHAIPFKERPARHGVAIQRQIGAERFHAGKTGKIGFQHIGSVIKIVIPRHKDIVLCRVQGMDHGGAVIECGFVSSLRQVAAINNQQTGIDGTLLTDQGNDFRHFRRAMQIGRVQNGDRADLCVTAENRTEKEENGGDFPHRQAITSRDKVSSGAPGAVHAHGGPYRPGPSRHWQ